MLLEYIEAIQLASFVVCDHSASITIRVWKQTCWLAHLVFLFHILCTIMSPKHHISFMPDTIVSCVSLFFSVILTSSNLRSQEAWIFGQSRSHCPKLPCNKWPHSVTLTLKYTKLEEVSFVSSSRHGRWMWSCQWPFAGVILQSWV